MSPSLAKGRLRRARLVLLVPAIVAVAWLWHLRSAADPLPLTTPPASQTVSGRILPPPGYTLVQAAPDSFAAYLADLPLKPGRPPVYLYNGKKKFRQDAHHAVLAVDVGDKDLQQCADAVIRLRAEYLYAQGRYDDIHFNFTSGDRADFSRWAQGHRPRVEGNRVRWARLAGEDYSYASFRKYLDTVFSYAGTASLAAELERVPDINDMRPGDVFIKGGFPGHAVIVVNMAQANDSGKKLFLLAQSYMPAQEIHILRNPHDGGLSPWYSLDFEGPLRTPEYTFTKERLMRFRAPSGDAAVPAASAATIHSSWRLAHAWQHPRQV